MDSENGVHRVVVHEVSREVVHGVVHEVVRVDADVVFPGVVDRVVGLVVPENAV